MYLSLTPPRTPQCFGSTPRATTRALFKRGWIAPASLLMGRASRSFLARGQEDLVMVGSIAGEVWVVCFHISPEHVCGTICAYILLVRNIYIYIGSDLSVRARAFRVLDHVADHHQFRVVTCCTCLPSCATDYP